jgi:hypothetical protein
LHHEADGSADISAASRAAPQRRFFKVDYMPDGTSSPLEHKGKRLGYLEGRLVALDYPAIQLTDMTLVASRFAEFALARCYLSRYFQSEPVGTKAHPFLSKKMTITPP